MFTLFRLLFFTALVYGGFLVAFPQWDGVVYHVASLAVLGGAAVGVCIIVKVIDFTSTAAKLAFEAAFVLAAAGWFAYTMPTKSGATPWQQWAAGHRPNQTEARDGFTRLGVDPKSGPASLIVGLFPR